MTKIDGLDTRLKQLRHDRHLTQLQVANAVHISSALISAYELGSRVPPLDNLIRIAKFYHVTTDFLLGCESKLPVNLDGLAPKDKEAVLTIIKSLKEKAIKD